MKKGKPAQILPRFRIVVGDEIAMGPGKAELLEAIAETGSIRLAAKHLGMSYMRAWKLVQTMNTCFRNPITITTRGGGKGGQTHLTNLGARILKLYRTMERKSAASTRLYWQSILRELKR